MEMEAKGGCCIARFSGNAYPAGSPVDRIMLRFRPIAPKPAANAPRPFDYSPAFVGGGRTKRGGVSREKRRCRKQRKAVCPVVTLPLLPEAPEPKGSPPRDSPPSSQMRVPPVVEMQQMWVPPVIAPATVRPAWTCVMVEKVVELSGEGGWGMGGEEEEEIRRGLEAEEACPGLVTDAWNCVRWVNEAFRRMVGGKQKESGGVMVALVAKEKLPEAEVRAFTCRVRVEYTCDDKDKNSLTAPCDVWRLDGGGFAWRLDVKAALCLGR